MKNLSLNKHRIIICKFCGSNQLRKNGKDQTTQQRFFCKECKRSFYDDEDAKHVFIKEYI